MWGAEVRSKDVVTSWLHLNQELQAHIHVGGLDPMGSRAVHFPIVPAVSITLRGIVIAQPRMDVHCLQTCHKAGATWGYILHRQPHYPAHRFLRLISGVPVAHGRGRVPAIIKKNWQSTAA